MIHDHEATFLSCIDRAQSSHVYLEKRACERACGALFHTAQTGSSVTYIDYIDLTTCSLQKDAATERKDSSRGTTRVAQSEEGKSALRKGLGTKKRSTHVRSPPNIELR